MNFLNFFIWSIKGHLSFIINTYFITIIQVVHVKDTKDHKNKGWKKGLNLIFKQGTKQNYVIQKIRTEDLKTKTQDVHDKYEHGKNLTRLWCKIMLKIGVEQIKRNEGSYSYSYSFGDLVQGHFQWSFYVCIK